MVVVILVVLWIVVLAPLYLKGRTLRGSTTSIDSFHRQLHLLERTGPKLVVPAYRLETATPAPAGDAPGSAATGLPVVSSGIRRPNLVLLRPVDDRSVEGDDIVDDGAGGHYRRVLPEPAVEPAPTPMPETEGPVRAGPDPYRRQLARRRRRDTLTVLVSVLFLSGLLGLLLGVPGLWVLTGLAALALGAYGALVAYAQNLVVDHGSRRPSRTTGASEGIYDLDTAEPGNVEDDRPYHRVAAGR
jgi:hypothetical protein